MLEALMFLVVAALPPRPAAPSAELLEFLAEWPDEAAQSLLDGRAAAPVKDKDQNERQEKPDAKLR
ncbi:hypothetical protein [Solimonas sp. SE-A11]|uniref:hypothetical protein n=1 Tax=Solimonas sp. SE-A11 TaxID=3054954 RepID=UPI00259CE818|nr:hypothetical protein [Solimonas sp. SE-A11]MDM4771534.1 hypothetical protein [Solimonas sp. SE-A11]